MRKLLFGAATSLDGFIARPDGAVDWLHWSADVAAITASYWSSIDAVVMGRKTYDVVVASGTSTYAGKRTYVYSRTLAPRVDAGLEVVAADAVDHIGRLKRAPGAGICLMGGGELARDLFEAGLVDEVGVNIHPVLLGSGIPMFHRMARQIDLRIIETKPLKHGCVYILYAVVAGRKKQGSSRAQSN
jgi:dihydrofolate reductase